MGRGGFTQLCTATFLMFIVFLLGAGPDAAADSVGNVGAATTTYVADRADYWMIKAGLHLPSDMYFEPAYLPDPHADFSLGMAYSTPFGQRPRISGFVDWHRMRPGVPFTVFGMEFTWETKYKIGEFRFQPGAGIGLGFIGGGYHRDDTHFNLLLQLITDPRDTLGWLVELKLSLLDGGGYGLTGEAKGDDLITLRGGLVF